MYPTRGYLQVTLLALVRFELLHQVCKTRHVRPDVVPGGGYVHVHGYGFVKVTIWPITLLQAHEVLPGRLCPLSRLDLWVIRREVGVRGREHHVELWQVSGHCGRYYHWGCWRIRCLDQAGRSS